MTTWRKLIQAKMEEYSERWQDTVHCTLTDEQLDHLFDDGYGVAEGAPFTLWTYKRVYFPVVYDGAEWVGSVSRYPDEVATEHVGGQ